MENRSQMVLGHILPLARRKNRFSGADVWGENVAHHDLVSATLRHCSVIDRMDVFTPRQMVDPEALDELRLEFGQERIRSAHLCNLQGLSQKYPYIFPVNPSTFIPMARLRNTSEGSCFPLCAIVHAIPNHLLLSLYMELLSSFQVYDTIVATSSAGQKSLEMLMDRAAGICSEAFGVDISRRVNITRIPLGVDTDFLCQQSQAQAREALSLSQDCQIILYVGRLSEQFKADLEPLISVLERLVVSGRKVLLLIAGRSSEEQYEQKLLSYAERLRVREHVKLITNFPFYQKPLLYSCSDIFVSPVDNIQETFGLSILEAMACGIPVVASDWSGYRDLVIDGVTGYLIPTIWCSEAGCRASAMAPGLMGWQREHLIAQRTVVDNKALFERVRELLDNQELRRRFGTEARSRAVSTFGWKRVISQFADLWAGQRERLAATNVFTRLPECGFNEVFGHFATRVLDENTIVALVCQYPGMAELQEINYVASDCEWIEGEPDEAVRVLRACATGPHSLKTLMARGGPSTPEVVARLMKKGLLEEFTSDN